VDDPLLQDAADHGHGKYYTAQNGRALTRAFDNIISRTIDASTSYTAPVVPISHSNNLFTKSNPWLTNQILGVANDGEKDTIIDFIRGYDADDEDIDSERSTRAGPSRTSFSSVQGTIATVRPLAELTGAWVLEVPFPPA
jgi:hypothetical protein